MSKSTFADAFAPAEEKYKTNIDWQGAADDASSEYTGWLVFTWASDGTLCPIDYDFVNLDGSPWLYDLLVDFIYDHKGIQGEVYRWEGTFKNYKLKGKITLINTKGKS